MPFVSEMGGWVERCPVLGGKEIKLCLGSVFPYDYDNPATYQVWYKGSFSTSDRRFNENETPLWRVQTHTFTKEMWQWFLDGREVDSTGYKSGERVRDRMACHYIEDGLDVRCIHKHLTKEFEYPTWVLQELINDGTITNQNLIDAIAAKVEEERRLGLNIASSSESKIIQEVDPKLILAKEKLQAMKAMIDPKEELKGKKKKEKVEA